MKKQKLKVEIEVWGIEVEQTHFYEGNKGAGGGWYKYEYSIKTNGGKKKYGQEDGSWSSQTKKQFRQILSRGHAAKLVLERI